MDKRPSKMTEEELHRLNIYHVFDDNHSKRQLQSLYGLVNEDQDIKIISTIHGKSVLDVGAGYGTLSRRLLDKKFDVTSIEPDPHARKLAREWYGIDEYPFGIYKTPFEDNYFDTVILRECVEHLIFPEAMKEINRICNSRILIFQTNLNPLISLARKRMGHEEFQPMTLSYYKQELKTAGFVKQGVIYRDPLAFPISGGYHTRQIFPHIHKAERGLLLADRFLNKVIWYAGLSSTLCWRYLLIADKECI